ncbi:MAG: CoA ester lyase [Actinomycetota bacterium]|nr:CoA ester lyase [Actinomycetota bacterium]
MRSRRSCLSVPGSSAKMLDKARGLDADEIVIDLEDAVVPAAKDEARAAVAAALREGEWQAGTVTVRINATATEWCEYDIRELIGGGRSALDCLVVPKVESPADIELVERLVDRAEADGESDEGVGLQGLVETAIGLRRVYEIAESGDRLEALIIGFADLAASLGRPGGTDYPGDSWHWVRETVLVAARAAGLQAIDGPHLRIEDLDGLREEALRARALGYDGKWALHPTQVAPLNEIFGPSQEEFDRSAAILAALDEGEQGRGRGAVMLDGEMLDEASRKLAAQVVARGQAAGLGS